MKRFFPTRSQWLGIALLAILSVTLQLAVHLSHTPALQPPLNAADSLYISSLSSQAKSATYTPPLVVRLRPFDPNTADSLTLRELGMPAHVAHSLLNYRRHGGEIRSKEKLSAIYNMPDTLYRKLEPYIVIDSTRLRQYNTRRDTLHQQADTTQRDTIHSPNYVRRVKCDTILCLNNTDTTELMLLRYVGPYTARCIIRYGEQLGGYASTEQIREIKQLTNKNIVIDSILPHLTVDTSKIQRLPVNRLSVKQLARHPYIGFTQAKAIYELRQRRLRLKSIDELRRLDCLSDEDIERLRPYLSFEEAR